MPQDTLEITNLESLFGEIEQQEELFEEPMIGIGDGGMVMTTMPCATTATRISVATKC